MSLDPEVTSNVYVTQALLTCINVNVTSALNAAALLGKCNFTIVLKHLTYTFMITCSCCFLPT